MRLILIILFISTIASAATVKFQADGSTVWQAWSSNENVNIRKEISPDGKTTVEFTLPAGKLTWNTPMLNLPQKVPVTAFTVLKFRCLADKTGVFEVNLHNFSEGAEYSTRFKTTAGSWLKNTIALKDALYKRHGKAGTVHDGLMGDLLSRIQLAYRGNRIVIADFQLLEADPDAIPDLREQPEYMKTYLRNRQFPEYRQFKRNAVFPFGVISTVGAGNRVNGGFFGQTTDERQEDDLRDIRLRGFNAYSNFVGGGADGIAKRLELMEKYKLYLIETATCGMGIHRLPADSLLAGQIRKYSNHPRLLCWYGQDEPTNGEQYLQNKAWVEKPAGANAPFTSAMHMLNVVQEIGPAMELIMLDPYSLTPAVTAGTAENVLANHKIRIEKTREFSAGGRVWMIPQAFSMRHSGSYTLRYPSPAEARYDIFNALAAGANGFIYFIYNDTVPYLDGKIRGEEFDQTMVDAWGNGNPTTDAQSIIAKRLTAIMPSFIERKPAENQRSIKLPESWKSAQWQTEDGILLIVVNRDLFKESRNRVAIQLKPGEKLYDLDKLQEAGELQLLPGDGALLLIATPDKWPRVMNEVQGRIEKHEKEIASLKEDFPLELLAIQKIFGNINAMLVVPEVINRIDAKPEWEDFREKMKSLSKDYFTARREWRQKQKTAVDLKILRQDVEKLLHEAKTRIAQK